MHRRATANDGRDRGGTRDGTTLTTASMRDSCYIRAAALSGFDRLVIAKGGDPLAILRDVGIDPDVMDTPDMLIPFARKSALLELAARRLGAASLGLEWAQAVPVDFPHGGPMLLLAEAVETFGEWLERTVHYWHLQINAVVPQIVHYDTLDAAGLRIAQNGQAASRQHAEYILGRIVRSARAILGDGVDPVQVSFRHARPADTALHDLIFRCRLEFDAGHDEIVFHHDVMAMAVGRHANELEAIADELIRKRISLLQQYQPSVSTSTALAIKSVLGAGVCSKEFVARLLGSSPRKLHGLLAREGMTYEDVLDGVRREMACELLVRSNAPIAAIGSTLDFASPAAMTLALKRWTGMTPSAYRAQARAAANEESRIVMEDVQPMDARYGGRSG